MAACGKFHRLQKSTDTEKKYTAAVEYYEKGDYYRALALFEELISIYKGTKKAEKIYYYYAYCYYNQEDHVMAGYHFENFAKTFPNSDKAEECQFMNAYCYYKDSPGPTLDQENTHKAIRELQLFVNKYPKSARVTQCNDLLDMLRDKLLRKDYANAKLYFHMTDYKSAMVALRNVLKEYPECKYKEECLFLITKSNYLLATNSIDEKKEKRFKDTILAYYKFIDAFPNSKFLKEAELMFDTSHKMAEKYKQLN